MDARRAKGGCEVCVCAWKGSVLVATTCSVSVSRAACPKQLHVRSFVSVVHQAHVQDKSDTMASTETQQQQPEATGGNSANTSAPKGNVPRGPIRRHERIVTSDDEIKEFNKGYYQKAQSQYLDPCQAQTKASMKCMEANNFDKRRCTRFFKDYSDCKKKWVSLTSGSAS